MALDVEKMKSYQAPRAAPFLEFREPDGDVFYAYRIKAEGNITTRENKKFPNPDGSPRIEKHAVFILVDFKPAKKISRTRKAKDELLEVGKKYTVNLSRHASLERQFSDFATIDGVTFDVMNKGKNRTKKGIQFTDYVVLVASGMLDSSRLKSRLVEVIFKLVR